jgi:Glycoside hydrolase family 5 C-terminal domain
LSDPRSFFSLWNYNPENNDAEGDSWCGENFSWFGTAHRRSSTPYPSLSALKRNSEAGAVSLHQSNTNLDDGGRILHAVVRPYAAKVAGVPLRWAYELNSGQVEFEWQEPKGDDLRCRETQVFFPAMLLTDGRTIQVDGLDRETWRYDGARQTLFIVPPVTKSGTQGTKRSVVIRVDPPLEPLFMMTTHWQDFAKWYAGVGALVLGILGLLIKVALRDG